jgi:protein-tyrosine phosphatase
VDDGSKNLEQSLEMLRLAAENGSTDIVASPHANYEFKFDPAVVAGKLEELRNAAGGLIRVHAGCDFHLSFDNIQDAIRDPSKYTINHKRYLLVEFSDSLVPNTTDDVFYQMQTVGMIPIITHPERNMILQKRLPKLEEWVRSGCLLQVTGQSFLGRFGKQAKRFADQLLKRNLVQIVASDAHDTKYRPPLLKEAYEYVSKMCGEARGQALFVTNPGAVLTGTPIGPPDVEPQSSRKWFQFWN